MRHTAIPRTYLEWMLDDEAINEAGWKIYNRDVKNPLPFSHFAKGVEIVFSELGDSALRMFPSHGNTFFFIKEVFADVLEMEDEMVQYFRHWTYLANLIGQGRKTFFVSAGLAQALMDTDLTDILGKDLQLPFPAIQVMYENSVGEALNPGTGLMYPIKTHLAFSVDLQESARKLWERQQEKGYKGITTEDVNWSKTLEPGTRQFGFCYVAQHPQYPAEDVYNEGVHLIQDESPVLDGVLKDLDNRGILDPGFMTRLCQGKEGPYYSERTTHAPEMVDAYKEQTSIQLKLFMNVLLYLRCTSAEKEEIYHPVKLGNYRGKKNVPVILTRRDSKLPYTRLGGSIVIAPHEKGGSLGDTGRHLNVRFQVRGHWRRQACGTGRKDHKLMWIQPHWKGPELAERIHRDYTIK